MKLISSRDNPYFKTLRKLADSPRQRRMAGKTLLDGWHLVDAYRQAIGEPETLILSQSAADGHLAAGDAAAVVLSDGLFAELSPVKTPTGVLAVIPFPVPVAERTPEFCLLLEDVQDPGNLGSLLRSAAAAGCDTAYLSTNCADPWSPKALRAGMGAHFVLALRERAGLAQIAAAFPGLVVATSLTGDRSLYELDLTGAVAFVVGNEGAGISEALQAVASQRVRIPMPGAVESLNAAAATAICLFERVRQIQSK